MSDNSELMKCNDEIEKLIKDGNLHDVITDTTQLITEIPIIGTIVKAIKFTSALQQEIFARKLRSFLYELKDIPQEKRQQKIEEINNSEKIQYSIGLVILDELQRIDINYKPTILGKLFASYINEKINLEDYLRLVYIVSNTFYLDLINLKTYSSDGKYKSEALNFLITADGALVQTNFAIIEKILEDGDNISDDEKKELSYPVLTPLGNLFLKVGF